MKHAQSYLTALLSLVLAYAIGGAHAEEQSIELGLPKNPIYAGTNITIGFASEADDEDSYPFSATFFCIQSPNGTDVVSCSDSPGFSAVSDLLWDNGNWSIPTAGQCINNGANNDTTSFTFNSENWPAGSYALQMHRILLFGANGIEDNSNSTTAGSPGRCIQPPFSNETLESVTYLNFTDQTRPSGAATASTTTALSFETTTPRPSDAKDGSASGNGTRSFTAYAGTLLLASAASMMLSLVI